MRDRASRRKEETMKKAVRVILATIAVVIVLFVLDIVIHGVLLQESYRATAELWRPMGEMKLGLMRIVDLVSAAGFVSIYAFLVKPKSVKAGLLFGLLYGITTGIGMGYGSYAVMPIPYKLAFVWFNGTVVEALIAGLIAALIVRE
jgi:hypothetical protein